MGSRPRRLARWILRQIGTDSEPLVGDLLILDTYGYTMCSARSKVPTVCDVGAHWTSPLCRNMADGCPARKSMA